MAVTQVIQTVTTAKDVKFIVPKGASVPVTTRGRLAWKIRVGVRVRVRVRVRVGVGVRVEVRVGVRVGVAVGVRVRVGVKVRVTGFQGWG